MSLELISIDRYEHTETPKVVVRVTHGLLSRLLGKKPAERTVELFYHKDGWYELNNPHTKFQYSRKVDRLVEEEEEENSPFCEEIASWFDDIRNEIKEETPEEFEEPKVSSISSSPFVCQAEMDPPDPLLEAQGIHYRVFSGLSTCHQIASVENIRKIYEPITKWLATKELSTEDKVEDLVGDPLELYSVEFAKLLCEAKVFATALASSFQVDPDGKSEEWEAWHKRLNYEFGDGKFKLLEMPNPFKNWINKHGVVVPVTGMRTAHLKCVASMLVQDCLHRMENDDERMFGDYYATPNDAVTAKLLTNMLVELAKREKQSGT